jgi:hypothetical protein
MLAVDGINATINLADRAGSISAINNDYGL